jgi:CheY-like chemotaxis protein
MACPTQARVLIVEDEPAVVRMYGRGLEAAGYAVASAPDGAEALRMIALWSFDVVVSDVCMPRMGGLELAIEARRISPELPIVLMTAQLDAGVYARARAAGVVRYLLKPVGLEQLARAVGNAVKLKASLVRLQERKARAT